MLVDVVLVENHQDNTYLTLGARDMTKARVKFKRASPRIDDLAEHQIHHRMTKLHDLKMVVSASTS